MFKLLVAKPNFFSILLFLLIALGILLYNADFQRVEALEWSAIGIAVFSFCINIFFFSNAVLVKNINYNILVLLIFYWIGSDYLKDIYFSVAFLSISIINLLMNLEVQGKVENFYVLSAILVFIANMGFYATWAFTFLLLVSSILNAKTDRAFVKYVGTLIMCSLLLLQILYLSDQFILLENWVSTIQFSFPSWKNNFYYLLPTGIFIALGIIDHFMHSYQQSLLKRTMYNMTIFLFGLLSIELLVFYNNFNEILIYLFFPIVVFLGRYLSYVRNPYLQNLLMLLSLAALISIKLFDFSLL